MLLWLSCLFIHLFIWQVLSWQCSCWWVSYEECNVENERSVSCMLCWKKYAVIKFYWCSIFFKAKIIAISILTVFTLWLCLPLYGGWKGDAYILVYFGFPLELVASVPVLVGCLHSNSKTIWPELLKFRYIVPYKMILTVPTLFDFDLIFKVIFENLAFYSLCAQ